MISNIDRVIGHICELLCDEEFAKTGAGIEQTKALAALITARAEM